METVGVLVRRDVIKFLRQGGRMVGALVTPILVFVLFGSGIGNLLHQPWAYLHGILAGAMMNAVLLGATTAAGSVIWDREFGFLKIILLAPVHRAAIVAGKVLGGAVQAWLQGLAFLLFLPFIRLGVDPARLLAAVVILAAAAVSLSAVATAVALRSRTYEEFNVWMLLLGMPMLFVSGAFFPLHALGAPLAAAARCNPLSYAIDLLKHALVGAGPLGAEMPLWLDSTVTLAFLAGSFGLSVGLFSRREG